MKEHETTYVLDEQPISIIDADTLKMQHQLQAEREHIEAERKHIEAERERIEVERERIEAERQHQRLSVLSKQLVISLKFHHRETIKKLPLEMALQAMIEVWQSCNRS